MKLFIKLLLLATALAVVIRFFGPKNDQPLVSVNDKAGNISITVREREKEEFKEYLKKFKALIYREATKHNPEGDVLPDEIDDRVMGEVKERVN